MILESNEWTQIGTKGLSPGPIAFHGCVAVYKKERKVMGGLSLFKMPDILAP